VPKLTTEQLTLALAVVGGLALIALLTTLILFTRLRGLRRQYAVLRGDGEERDILAGLGRSMTRLGEMDKKMTAIVDSQEALAATGRSALQNFAIVRYDAFEDMGGQLSFSAAVLNDYGDGFVLTSINGRTETRTYAKPVKELDSPGNLSDEERDAIASAASGDVRRQSLPAGSHN
jgi:Protein of unknown function (DUF4446)